MKLTDYINPKCIKIDLSSEYKEEVIEELVFLLADCISDGVDPDAVYNAVMMRESEGSTGLEKGIAIPHAKCDYVDRLRIAIGISREGIDFDAQDGKPSKLFFLMVAPRNEAGPHVQAIARIVKITTMEGVKSKLLNANNPERVVEIIDDIENGS
ncbi:MAG: PTS sugar transporter subunit IIA [Candidatus Krumholzibacteriales bacterium]